ncbi:hypothetical protein HDU87_000289 [Geranomyces variabilis]|uniref:F-box domain-containing protein n=1 Tax=Geranomyces variabilis TaxID=109894 RepID=A0AAD5XR89_9FUNG|nr:hypothetical protein HDU87_000289 [Geranomyces variabilis]
MHAAPAGPGGVSSPANIHALPFEILSHIASYLATRHVVGRLSTVSHRFAEVARDVATLELDASEAVFDFGLQRIMQQHPRLQHLVLTPDRNLPQGRAAFLLDRVAAQFTGHPALKDIHCATDLIVPGAVDGCPTLQSLRVEPHLNETDGSYDPVGLVGQFCQEKWAAPGLRRNLAWILHTRPELRRVQLDDPHLWLRASHRRRQAPAQVAALRSLSLTSMAASSLLSLVELLQGEQDSDASEPRTALFPNLIELSMEIDYAFMPAAMFPALSLGCPNMASLTLSTLEAPPSLLPTMAKAFVSLPLEKLVFDKCSLWFVNGWSALVDYLTTALPNLKALEFERCLYRELPPGRTIPSPPVHVVAPFPLISLKLYYIGDFALSVEDVRHFVDRFTSLKDLRLDVPPGTCVDTSMHVWAPAAADKLKSLARLSLKSGSVHGMASMPCESDVMPRFEKLAYLSLTSCPVFPSNLIRCNGETLTTLKLNYLPAVLPAGSHIAFPKLKRLVVRGISTLGHKICLAATAALTFGAPSLECLTMESFSSTTMSLELPAHFLPDLLVSCPKIRSLRLSGFRMPSNALQLLQPPSPSPSSHSSSLAPAAESENNTSNTPWPHLATFHVWGAASLPIATPTWERTHLGPFLDSHRELASLHLGLSGISLLDEGLMLPRADDQARKRDVNWDTKSQDARGVYASYARRLLKRYVWLDDVLVSGPVAMEPRATGDVRNSLA